MLFTSDELKALVHNDPNKISCVHAAPTPKKSLRHKHEFYCLLGREFIMAKETRYAVQLDAYLWAKNDKEAKVKAAKIAEYLRELEDNQAKVIRLDETPFASCAIREVHKGRLDLFENKLIQG